MAQGAPAVEEDAKTTPRKGLTILYELLSLVQTLLEEFETLNFRGPMLPLIAPNSSSTTSTPGGSALTSPPPSSSQQQLTNNSADGQLMDTRSLQLHGDEAMLDSLTRVALLRDQYINLSTQLFQVCSKNHDEDTEAVDTDALVANRNSLRLQVAERNHVMKGLIDTFRRLQHQTSIIASPEPKWENV